ncbi:hypothetical protein KFU94_22455 [Chloroflexi bacterium TSY]|nr:hypothetical protein [Chloroflexi bacterium TSY]
MKKDLSADGYDTFRERISQLEPMEFEEDFLWIAYLDREDLLFSLFEEDGELWNEAAQSNIPPLHSVRLLSLRPTDSRWWDDKCYTQMIEIYEAAVGQ